jgi:hypothetical protein
MDRDVKGTDPKSATGTRDAIDPGTGAIGTAGTPVTGGYGASGSTIGTGSTAGEMEHVQGEYAGQTPSAKGYTSGEHGDSQTSITTDAGEVVATEVEEDR